MARRAITKPDSLNQQTDLSGDRVRWCRGVNAGDPYGHMWNGPRGKSFFRRFSRGRGAVICPAFLRGHRPLASMKSAMQVADQKIAL
jgi:hypothetical protein